MKVGAGDPGRSARRHFAVLTRTRSEEAQGGGGGAFTHSVCSGKGGRARCFRSPLIVILSRPAQDTGDFRSLNLKFAWINSRWGPTLLDVFFFFFFWASQQILSADAPLPPEKEKKTEHRQKSCCAVIVLLLWGNARLQRKLFILLFLKK